MMSIRPVGGNQHTAQPAPTKGMSKVEQQVGKLRVPPDYCSANMNRGKPPITFKATQLHASTQGVRQLNPQAIAKSVIAAVAA